jgi:putative transposase
VLNLSTSGHYDWDRRSTSSQDLEDALLIDKLRSIRDRSRAPYGVRRCHAVLRLAEQLKLGHKRVARLMRLAGLPGVHRRRWRHHQPAQATWPDRVERRFSADRPDQLWVTDITQHRTDQGWVYCAAVIDVFSRRCVGWSIADHLRTELVVDALDMARWRRKPIGTILHSDRGTQGGFNPLRRGGPRARQGGCSSHW